MKELDSKRGPQSTTSNGPLWQVGKFELKTIETQQMQKGAFLELPLSD